MCGQAIRTPIDSVTMNEDVTITARATIEIEESVSTIVWWLWARRAVREVEDARAARQTPSQVDNLPAIVFAIAAAAFALDGVALDFERPYGGKGHHPAIAVGRQRGDQIAAVFLHEIGNTSDPAGWRTRMHDLFELRNAFAAHPETVPASGAVSPARAALTLQAAEDAVALLRECLAALHDGGRVPVSDDLL